eukprot:CAMPEP_0194127254 /NCGR_PEP_ID=MMETSP0150-20130528/60425_1 /TAXON_ID=122233 /ORGANISM="Chaetoceros debilis, Strain MM31A-1" /LENGTH=809 /DNA_ID=CAMNT_0038821171 /DNA_START=76 /DNA_END=2505 /DNA_ORIENTATION=+
MQRQQSMMPSFDPLLRQLDISKVLRSRITSSTPCSPTTATTGSGSGSDSVSNTGYVLYLPTNNLRQEHNPAFALACHIANHYQIPLLVLAVALDDGTHVLPGSLSPSSTVSSSSSSLPSSSSSKLKSIVMTARRLAFHIEALASASSSWSNHGAAVAIRIHGPGARRPDHLTLARRARAVVCDEPFVHPFLNFVQSVERVCGSSSNNGNNVPCYRVDGNTTVPPAMVLKKNNNNSKIGNKNGNTAHQFYTGVPSKAWMWQKKTESMRMEQLYAALQGELDAPELKVCVEEDAFFLDDEDDDDDDEKHGHDDQKDKDHVKDDIIEIGSSDDDDENDGDDDVVTVTTNSKRQDQLSSGRQDVIEIGSDDDDDFNDNDNGNDNSSSSKSKSNSNNPTHPILSPALFPSAWRNRQNDAPGIRPWTVNELQQIHHQQRQQPPTPSPSTSPYEGIKQWVMSWPGADTSVPPCLQTMGTHTAGMNRWNNFLHHTKIKGLTYYARRRTDPKKPHASSRMSCYFNLGIVSIFKCVHDVKVAQKDKVSGADKFEEEIVKWREMSYAHAFSRGDYHGIGSVPQWAIRWIEEQRRDSGSGMKGVMFDAQTLETSSTGNDKWDAMQQYLVDTGELHNNVRMTWGKELVHWGVAHSTNSTTTTTSNDLDPTTEILQILVYLNDRYALDGLSPPSYAGLLWCMGWCDKPGSKGTGGGISSKPASRYRRASPADFLQAQQTLLECGVTDKNGENTSTSSGGSRIGGLSTSISAPAQQTSIFASLQNQKKQVENRKRKEAPTTCDQKSTNVNKAGKTLHHFFKKTS